VTLHIDVTDTDGAEAAVATGPNGGDADADAGGGGGDNDDDDDGKDALQSDPDSPDTTPAPADFTWTSDDVMSLNFFFFQINEFTKRALKFAVEPGEEFASAHDLKAKTAATGAAGSAAAAGPSSTEGRAAGWFDPTSLYHLGSVRRVPVFLLAFIRSTLRSQWASLRASCVWDEQRFIESAKLALAIVLASANELTPRSWTPIYERKSHGWWAPVTVAFTMSDNLGTHVTSMVLRVLGTLAGAVFGYVAKVVCQGELVALVAVLVVWNVLTTVQRSEPKFGYAWLVAGSVERSHACERAQRCLCLLARACKEGPLSIHSHCVRRSPFRPSCSSCFRARAPPDTTASPPPWLRSARTLRRGACRSSP